MAAGFPSGYDTFIPGNGRKSRKANGQIIVGFSRNAKNFTLPNYCQYVPITEPVGYYLKITNQEAARIVNVDDFAWPDGAARPQRNRGTESFRFVPFRTERYDYGFVLGKKSVENASWDIINQHSGITAAQCMTSRTMRAVSALTTSANWTASTDEDLTVDHYSATATALGVGGSVYAGTSTDPRFLQMCNLVAQKVTLDTLAVVKGQPDEMSVMFNPVTASNLAKSAEIHDYLKGSPDAIQTIINNISPNAMYGLPERLYGYRVIVEPSVKVTSRSGTTLNRTFVMPDNAIVFTSRVGGLEGVYGAPSFSTLTSFLYEEMTVEVFSSPRDRREEGHVAEDTFEAVTCPASGWYIANAGA